MKTVKCEKVFFEFPHLTAVKDIIWHAGKNAFFEFLKAVKDGFLTKKNKERPFPQKTAFPKKVRIAVKGNPKSKKFDCTQKICRHEKCLLKDHVDFQKNTLYFVLRYKMSFIPETNGQMGSNIRFHFPLWYKAGKMHFCFWKPNPFPQTHLNPNP